MNETISFLHGYGSRVLIIYAVVLGLWGTLQYFRDQRVSSGFRAGFLIMAGLTPLQGLFGVAALLLGSHPREGILHMVYGIFAALFLPGAYVYAHQGNVRREALILAGAAWIVSIAFFRGISTG